MFWNVFFEGAIIFYFIGFIFFKNGTFIKINVFSNLLHISTQIIANYHKSTKNKQKLTQNITINEHKNITKIEPGKNNRSYQKFHHKQKLL